MMSRAKILQDQAAKRRVALGRKPDLQRGQDRRIALAQGKAKRGMR